MLASITACFTVNLNNIYVHARIVYLLLILITLFVSVYVCKISGKLQTLVARMRHWQTSTIISKVYMH